MSPILFSFFPPPFCDLFLPLSRLLPRRRSNPVDRPGASRRPAPAARLSGPASRHAWRSEAGSGQRHPHPHPHPPAARRPPGLPAPPASAAATAFAASGNGARPGASGQREQGCAPLQPQPLVPAGSSGSSCSRGRDAFSERHQPPAKRRGHRRVSRSAPERAPSPLSN